MHPRYELLRAIGVKLGLIKDTHSFLTPRATRILDIADADGFETRFPVGSTGYYYLFNHGLAGKCKILNTGSPVSVIYDRDGIPINHYGDLQVSVRILSSYVPKKWKEYFGSSANIGTYSIGREMTIPKGSIRKQTLWENE
jgi:hypothetical protein